MKHKDLVDQLTEAIKIDVEVGDTILAGRFKNKKVKVWVLPAKKSQVSLKHLLSRLAREEVTTLLVEGGGEVSGSFLRGGLIDQVAFYIAPLLIGGENAPGILRGKGAARLSGAWELRKTSVRKIGPDFLIEGCVKPRKNTGTLVKRS